MAVPDDEIRLVIPTDPAYGRIARIAAASLAVRMGFTNSEVEDLRIAVDEMFILLSRPDDDGMRSPAASPGRISFTFEIRSDRIEVRADTEITDTDGQPCHEDCSRFGEIIHGIVDAYSVDTATRTITITKVMTATH